MQKILIIQTAFIGDVVLATAMIEKIKIFHPTAMVDVLVRKGNESLLQNNPHINQVLVWNKKENKLKNLFNILQQIRKTRYDKVINVQRFFATGLLTAFSKANQKIGFDKNPLSIFYTTKVPHVISNTPPYRHEVERNNDLIKHFTDDTISLPKLYPSAADYESVEQYSAQPYVTMTPSSVWFTKKFPFEKWIELIDKTSSTYNIYLLGGKDNIDECKAIQEKCTNPNVQILAGKLSFLQSTALMKNAAMNYVNDSAPLHFASAVNAPVTAFFCSTIPAFGFTPLSTKSIIIQTEEKLTCRPCGLHGKKQCPLQHFKCGYGIEVDKAVI
ncbi:MAG: glycosyltransferase family 9 protein [Ferruginibacter sp.]|nr:glycosyltransferase family 9 protein [Ferruginibacter sp.]